MSTKHARAAPWLWRTAHLLESGQRGQQLEQLSGTHAVCLAWGAHKKHDALKSLARSEQRHMLQQERRGAGLQPLPAHVHSCASAHLQLLQLRARLCHVLEQACALCERSGSGGGPSHRATSVHRSQETAQQMTQITQEQLD